MIDVILAAGYATRLYPLTENFPKPLLRVGGQAMLDRLLTDLDAMGTISRHVVVTNHKFLPHFEAWRAAASYRKPVELVDDGSETNELRLGAVRDLLFAVQELQLDDDLLVAAADNVLDFSLAGFVQFFLEVGTSVLMCHDEPSVEALQRTGVICLDPHGRVTLMEEKPRVPKTHWAVPPFYIYARRDLPVIRTALANGCGADAPGNLAHFMVDHAGMHAWHMPGSRYDIGDLAHYKAADALFSKQEPSPQEDITK